MDFLISVLLGAVQGITEFLPISSSGHLIFLRDLTNTQFEYGLSYDAVLQFATTLAILVYFRKDVIKLIKYFFLFIKGKLKDREQKIMLLSIIVGTIPAFVLGLLLENMMDTVFRNSILVALSLIAGSLVMFLADKFSKNDKSLDVKKSFIIGIFQSFALIPGMSRSGMTISGGLLLGLKRELAIKFSFLLAIPILLGSGFKKTLDLGSSGLLDSVGLELILGSLTAFVVGLLTIKFLLSYLQKNNFNLFVYYRLILALLILIVNFWTH